MKGQVSFLCIVALAGLFGANAVEMEVTPVQKVVQLLQGMLAKGKQEKHEEQVLFAAQSTHCESTETEKNRAIKSEKQKISGLKAQISKDTADIATLGKRVSALDQDMDTWSGDIGAASKQRATEKGDYDGTHKDYSESIDAVGRAIGVMKKTSKDRSQASFVQVSTLSNMKLIPDAAKKTIDAFLQQDAESNDAIELEGAPEANAYEFQSQGVVDMLSKLQSKFVDERTNLEKQEANSKNSYDLLVQDLRAQIKQAKHDHHSKQTSKGKRLASKADATGAMKQESKMLSSDEKFLADLKATCTMQKSDFEARQQLRSEEIIAIEKAVEIISGGAVSGAADKHLPSFVQKRATSLGQLRSNLNMEMQMQKRVGLFLHARAGKLNSRVLSAVAQRASADPMAKVKSMIKDLVTKLLEEANEEAEHKGFCDKELGTNAQTRKEKTDGVETLTADIEGLTASIAQLTESISANTKQVADLDASSAEATNIRIQEKSKNKATIEDSKQAQAAVAQALTVLKEFYAKAAEATAFVQEPYQGMAGESGGVVGMLEVIESDFARLESETASSEATAQKEYDSSMTDTKVSKADKEADIEHKTAKKQDQEQALTTAQSDLEGEQKELDAALAYFDKLKPSCVDSGVSYEDRVQRRKDEIKSLQEALQIMNGEDIA